MATVAPRRAQAVRFRDGWSGFRRWRRTRPFWGGLLTATAGLEIFGTTQMSLQGLTFQLGPTGFLSWLIPTILVTCGLLMWFKPQQRVFYAVVAAVTALFSLVGVNLGGFFFGVLLGTVGGALGFAWVPGAPSTGGSVGEVHDDETTPDSSTEPESAADDPQPHEPADDATVRGEQEGREIDLGSPDPGRRGPIAKTPPSSTS
ncbi:DUF6114 domain-containing protein [Micromonospora sp. CPCC 205543]